MTGVQVEYDPTLAAGALDELSSAPNIILKYGEGVYLSALMEFWEDSNLIAGTDATFITDATVYTTPAELVGTADDGPIQTTGHFSLGLPSIAFGTSSPLDGQWALVTQDIVTSWVLPGTQVFAITQTLVGPASESHPAGIQIEYDASVATYSGVTIQPGGPETAIYQIKYGDITIAALMESIDSDSNLPYTAATLDGTEAVLVIANGADLALKSGDDVLDFDTQSWVVGGAASWASLGGAASPVFVEATWTIAGHYLRLGHEVDPSEGRTIRILYNAGLGSAGAAVGYDAGSGQATILYGPSAPLSAVMGAWETYVANDNLSSAAAVAAGDNPAEISPTAGFGVTATSGAELAASGLDIPLQGTMPDGVTSFSYTLDVAQMDGSTVAASQDLDPQTSVQLFFWDMPEVFDHGSTTTPNLPSLSAHHTVPGGSHPYGGGISISHDPSLPSNTGFAMQVQGSSPNEIIAITYNDSRVLSDLMTQIKSTLEGLVANSTATVTLGGDDAATVAGTANDVLLDLNSQRLLFDVATPGASVTAYWGFKAAYSAWQVKWNINQSYVSGNPNQGGQAHVLMLTKMSENAPHTAPGSEGYAFGFEYDPTASSDSVVFVPVQAGVPEQGGVWKYAAGATMLDLMDAWNSSTPPQGDIPMGWATVDDGLTHDQLNAAGGDFTLIAFDATTSLPVKALNIPEISVWDDTGEPPTVDTTWPTVTSEAEAGDDGAPVTLNIGATVTLPTPPMEGQAGGVWTTSNAGIAMIDAVTGVVTAGGTEGVVTMTYTVTDSAGSDTAVTEVTVVIMQEIWHAEFLIQGTGGQENSVAASYPVPPCTMRVEYNAGAAPMGLGPVTAPAGGIGVTYNSVLAHTAPISPMGATQVENPPTEILYDMNYPVSEGSFDAAEGMAQTNLTFISELMAALYAQSGVSEVYLMFDASIGGGQFLASDLGNGNDIAADDPDLSTVRMGAPSSNDMYDFPIEFGGVWNNGPHLTVAITAWGSTSTATWGT